MSNARTGHWLDSVPAWRPYEEILEELFTKNLATCRVEVEVRANIPRPEGSCGCRRPLPVQRHVVALENVVMGNPDMEFYSCNVVLAGRALCEWRAQGGDPFHGPFMELGEPTGQTGDCLRCIETMPEIRPTHLAPGQRVRHVNQEWATKGTGTVALVKGPYSDGSWEYLVMHDGSFAGCPEKRPPSWWSSLATVPTPPTAAKAS